jgi:hypothetical protein
MHNPEIKKYDLLKYRSEPEGKYYIALENQEGWWIKIKCIETGFRTSEIFALLKVIK